MNISALQLRNAANIKERIEILEAELARVLSGRPPVIKTSTPKLLLKPRDVTLKDVDRCLKRRRMSPEARAKISAAAKRRWAKAKTAGRKSL